MNTKGSFFFFLFTLKWVSSWILKDEEKKSPKSQGNSDQNVRISLSNGWGHTWEKNTHPALLKERRLIDTDVWVGPKEESHWDLIHNHLYEDKTRRVTKHSAIVTKIGNPIPC